MASTTFTLETTKEQGRYLKLECSQTKDISTNKSKIKWTLSSIGGSVNYYDTGPTTVKINGETVYSEVRKAWDSYAFPAAKGSTSGETEVSHDNEGKATISCSIETAIRVYALSTVSGNWELESIPRAAQLTAAAKITDEYGYAEINFNNPAGAAVSKLELCIGDLKDNALTPYKTITDKTATSYRYPLTDSDKDILRNYIGPTAKSASIRYYLKTTIGSQTLWSTMDKTVEIVNGEPTLTPTVYDTLHTDLTGSGNRIIKGYNNVYAKADAAGVKGAYITKYYIRCGDDMLTTSDGRFINVESAQFVFTVVDSRGLTTSKTVDKTLVDYFSPWLSMSSAIDLDEGEEAETATAKISFEGSFFNSSFGAVNNTFALEYQFRNTDDDYGDVWSANTPTINGNKITHTITKTNLPYNETYSVRARYKDKVRGYIYLEEQVFKAVPVYDWSGDDFNFNVPVSINNKTIAYPIEKGEANGWTYVKWSNGIGECWKTLQHTTAVSTAWGSLYSGTATSRQAYPIQFRVKPVEIASLTAGNIQGLLFPEKDGNGENSYQMSACYNICRPSSANSSTFYISLYVKGKI